MTNDELEKAREKQNDLAEAGRLEKIAADRDDDSVAFQLRIRAQELRARWGK